MTYSIIILFLFDVFIFLLFWRFFYKNKDSISILRDISKTHQEVLRQKKEIFEYVDRYHLKLHEQEKKLISIAAELEKDLEKAIKLIEGEVQEFSDRLVEKFSEPIQIMNKKKSSLILLNKKADQRTQSLAVMLRKVENLLRFFQKSVPYERVLEDIETKKFQDTESLLSQGVPISQISREVGLTENEVALVRSVV